MLFSQYSVKKQTRTGIENQEFRQESSAVKIYEVDSLFVSYINFS